MCARVQRPLRTLCVKCSPVASGTRYCSRATATDAKTSPSSRSRSTPDMAALWVGGTPAPPNRRDEVTAWDTVSNKPRIQELCDTNALPRVPVVAGVPRSGLDLSLMGYSRGRTAPKKSSLPTRVLNENMASSKTIWEVSVSRRTPGGLLPRFETDLVLAPSGLVEEGKVSPRCGDCKEKLHESRVRAMQRSKTALLNVISVLGHGANPRQESMRGRFQEIRDVGQLLLFDLESWPSRNLKLRQHVEQLAETDRRLFPQRVKVLLLLH